MKLTLKEKVAVAAFAFHVAVILPAGGLAALGHFLSIRPLLETSVLLLVVHGLAFRRLGGSILVQQLLIRGHRCEACGHDIRLAGVRWRCQCSFVSCPRSCLGP